MLTNLNNINILQALSSGLPLFIMEYYPSIKPGVVVAPVEENNALLTPIMMSAQRGYVQSPVEVSNGKNQQILTFEQYNASFTDYYNSIISQFVNSNIKIQLSHIGVETLYRNYKYISEFYTVGGLVNITESSEYVKLEVDTNKVTIIRGIPELAVFGVSYRTFCNSIVRMFPEMDNSLSLAGSLYAYAEYLKLFNKEDITFSDYPLIAGMDLTTISNQIGMITQGIDENIIRAAIRDQNDSPMLQNYIKFMVNNNIPSKVAINLLAYHPAIRDIAINGVRGALALPTDKELSLPVILTIKGNSSSATLGGLF
jgi:hypothetical protein